MIVTRISGGSGRTALRRALLVARERFVAGPHAAAAAESLARRLLEVVGALEPELLGVYWPVRSEFNAVNAICADKTTSDWPLALPDARRDPPGMSYRRWDGGTPPSRDAVGVPTSDGPEAVPDVVLVPCVGFTVDGFRLGYGGGFFDRWLADHPATTAVGVAWSVGRIGAGDFEPRPHDLPLTLIVTDAGIVG